MQDMQDKTSRELAKDCNTVEDVHEMLKNLFKDTLQRYSKLNLIITLVTRNTAIAKKN